MRLSSLRALFSRRRRSEQHCLPVVPDARPAASFSPLDASETEPAPVDSQAVSPRAQPITPSAPHSQGCRDADAGQSSVPASVAASTALTRARPMLPAAVREQCIQEPAPLNGNVEDYLCAEFELQQRRHADSFASLLEGIREVHNQREVEFQQLRERTRAGFRAAQDLRAKQWLELCVSLDLCDNDIRDEIKQQEDAMHERHDGPASYGLAVCMQRVYEILAEERQLCQAILDRIQSPSYRFRQFMKTLLLRDSSIRTNVINAVERDLMREYSFPDDRLRQIDDMRPKARVYTLPVEQCQHVEGMPTNLTTEPSSPVPSSPSTISTSSSTTQPAAVPVLLERFEEHFADRQHDRASSWRDLKDEYGRIYGAWKESFDRLLEQLAQEFDCSLRQLSNGGTSICGGDEATHRSICDRFSDREDQRNRHVSESWELMSTLFARQRVEFIVRVRNVHRGIEAPPMPFVVQPPLSVRRIFFPSISAYESVGTPGYTPPFSPGGFFAYVSLSSPRPTAPASVQVKRAFDNTQRARDREFEESQATMSAESRFAEDKRTTQFAQALRWWQSRATRAERDRDAAFACNKTSESRRREDANRQRKREVTQLLTDLGEHFDKAQSERERLFYAALEEQHEDFLAAIKKLED